MSISTSSFGKLSDGREVTIISLTGTGGLKVSLLNYGARVQSLVFGGVDTVLGFDTADGYEKCTSYQGATIGRYANRIDGGKFRLNGKVYDVGANSSGVHLHGGTKGFDKQIWRYELLDDSEPSVRFKLLSPDGDMGYPGNLEVEVTYTVSKDNVLVIDYEACSDADTVLSLTNHSYFNLNGKGNILDTWLQLNASYITPVNDLMIPTGELMPVEGTPFDFGTAKPIGADIACDFPQLVLAGGYDHNYVLGGSGMRLAASAYSPESGIVMECFTDRPAMQLYTSNCLDENEGAGKDGVPLFKWEAFCLETQAYPDSPNQPDFPSAVLNAKTLWRSRTAYAFSKK